MKITFEGREWTLDLEAITLKQAIAIHLAYGFTLDGWIAACGNADPRAFQCLYWLMLQQDGQEKPIKDCDCTIVALGAAFADAQADTEEEPPADPTSSPGSPPGDQPSPGPATRTATTRTPPVPRERGRVTASMPVT